MNLEVLLLGQLCSLLCRMPDHVGREAVQGHTEHHPDGQDLSEMGSADAPHPPVLQPIRLSRGLCVGRGELLQVRVTSQ